MVNTVGSRLGVKEPVQIAKSSQSRHQRPKCWPSKPTLQEADEVCVVKGWYLNFGGPILQALRNYRYDTPYGAMPFQGGVHSPKWCDTPSWHLVSHRGASVRYPICSIWCDNCAIPHNDKPERLLQNDGYKYHAI